jgi:hypothetical protein
MVTAAHVIAEDYDNIYIMLPDKELQLGGLLHTTPIPAGGTRDDDKIDIAVMELEDSVVADVLSSFKFIELRNIGIGHKLVNSHYYLSVGYPATKTKKLWSKDEISAIPYPYQTEPETSFEYERLGFRNYLHIAVKFDGLVTSESNPAEHAAPKMNGVSGSGLWFLKGLATPSMVEQKQLVGIIIERESKDRQNKALIATRVDVVTEFIRQRFGLSIPKSTVVKVNILPPVPLDQPGS